MGKQFKLFGSKVEVIGVIKKEGEDMFGNSSDDKVIIPVNFARKYIDIRDIGTTILVKAKPEISNDELKDELVGVMRSVQKIKAQSR